MARTNCALVGISLVIAAQLALAGPPPTNQNFGTEMVSSLGELMFDTYACQTYLGGMDQYRLAKLHALEVATLAYGDRNKAEGKIDKIEQGLKTIHADKLVVEKFDRLKLSHADRVEACKELVGNAQAKLQHLELILSKLK